MTNQDNQGQENIGQEPNGPTIEHDPAEKRGRPLRVSLLVGAGLAAVIAIGAGAAIAKGGFGHMGGRFVEHRFEKMMDSVDATDAQQDKIWAIVDRTRGELRPMGRDFRDARGKMVELLTAPTIDKAAVETLRAERIAAMDAASKHVAAAAIEAAEALTPEQRAKLAEKMKEHQRDRW